MKSKARIVKRTKPDGSVVYVIQQRYFLFPWWWADAWVNSPDPYVLYEFWTLEEAKRNLCWYDGTKHKDEVVYP